MARAYSPKEITGMSIPELPLDGEWEKAFGRPALNDNWFIDGESASGKSSFVMMLAKKLCEYGNVLYWSLEEGAGLSFKKRLQMFNMEAVDKKMIVVVKETLDELSERLAKRRSPHFVIVDSVQYVGASFHQIRKKLLDRFPKKSFVFVSQLYRGEPKGKTANDLKFDAGIKIHTRGFRAYCLGRYSEDTTSYFTIWKEGAIRFYLNE
ncbi:MAG: AAA family ATPase [Candidatus Cryptobacteroides sp.]